MAYFRTTHKEIRIRLNKFALLTIPGDFKGTVLYIKKIEWGIIYLPRKKTTRKFYFLEILKKNLLSAYMENTLNGEKSNEIKHISVKFRTT